MSNHTTRKKDFSKEEKSKIVSLLKETDMPMETIAKRFNCGKHIVSAINKEYGIREYTSKSRVWTVPGEGGEIKHVSD